MISENTSSQFGRISRTIPKDSEVESLCQAGDNPLPALFYINGTKDGIYLMSNEKNTLYLEGYGSAKQLTEEEQDYIFSLATKKSCRYGAIVDFSTSSLTNRIGEQVSNEADTSGCSRSGTRRLFSTKREFATLQEASEYVIPDGSILIHPRID